MGDIELLESVLDKTAGVLEGVSVDQYRQPTPCPDYDVQDLVDHVTGWIQSFAAGAEGTTFEGDPGTHHAGEDPAGEFRTAADRVVAAWRTYGVDRKVGLMGGELPGPMVLNMAIMEYLAHGWDLATATGQAVPFTEDEAAQALERARNTLPPEYRGEGQPFGDIVEVSESAPAVERFIGFLGRDPAGASDA